MAFGRSLIGLLAIAAMVLGGGCTFTGLGDYDTTRCDAPRLPTSFANDPCAALASNADACTRWQCDAASGRCQLRTLDYDRDGEPSIACGGRDCDDEDARKTGSGTEVCDGIDNDCNGLADEGLVADLGARALASLSAHGDASLGSSNGHDVLGATVVDTCILAFRGTGETVTAPCTFPATDGVMPREPVARPIVADDVTFGALFVSQLPACPDGQLSFRNAKGAALDLPCASGGVSEPAFLPYRDGKRLAAASLRRPITATTACPDAAPLDLVWIDAPTATTAGPAPSVAAQRLGLAGALGPPAFVPLGDGLVLVAPSDGAAAAWLLPLGAGGTTPTVVPLLPARALGGLGGAREASTAVDVAGDALAIAATLGCPGSRLVLALVALAGPGPVATVTATVDVATTATHGARVAWVDARKEWWVSWLDAGGVEVRRFDAVGLAQGDALNISKRTDIIAVVPDLDASRALSVGYDFVTAHAVERASAGCPGP